MQLNGNMVIVPQWLRDITSQMGLPKSHLLNLNELSKHFSTDDLTTYHGINSLFQKIDFERNRGKEAERFICYSELFDSIDLVDSSKSFIDEDLSNSASQLQLLASIRNGGIVFLKETDSMNSFFNGVTSIAYGSGASDNPHLYVIELFHIEEQTFGLTLKLYDGVASDVEYAALERNVQLLLTHYKYEEVCQTPIFHRWCDCMYRNQ